MASQTERLQFLYDLSRRLATFHDLDELLRYATRGLREMFGADGSSILLLDPGAGELRFPVASLAENRRTAAEALSEVRFPSDKGIAGWVLTHGEAIAVDDVTHDARFYGGVDRATGLVTRSVLAAPMRATSGSLGVVEVINPSGTAVTSDDVKFLDALASDIAIAYEKADLHARLRQEIITLRQLARIAAAGMVVVGVVVALSGLFANLAWAKSWRTLLVRPPFVAGVLGAVAGGALLRAARARS